MTGYPSQLMADAIVNALITAQVRDVVYCPGSRDAPLAYALNKAWRAGLIRTHIRLDERGAAFVAVGISRAGGLNFGEKTEQSTCSRMGFAPVAIVTTSGSAVAELHAGVAEAYHSGIPLVIISADRPYELRGVGASQTTIQPGIFASHVRGQWDIPADTLQIRQLRANMHRAVAQACGLPSGASGPVHINVAFRDPLTPQTSGNNSTEDDVLAPSIEFSHAMRARVAPAAWEDVVKNNLRTIIVAGDGCSTENHEWVKASRLPVFAEPTTSFTRLPTWIPHQQALMRSRTLSDAVEQIILVGRPTLSRPITEILGRQNIRLVVISEDASWVDVHGRAHIVVPALAPPCEMKNNMCDENNRRWLSLLEFYSSQISAATRECAHSGEERPTLTDIALRMWEHAGGPLVAGASSTIRALDLVGMRPASPDVISNRGLAGIDGTIATAIGVAWGSGKPVRAMMGDLAFFYDASSLMMTDGALPCDLQIVVVDNDGGALFHELEHGREEFSDVYPRWFATPQRASIKEIARAYGAEYVCAHTIKEFERFLSEEKRGISIIHVHVASGSIAQKIDEIDVNNKLAL